MMNFLAVCVEAFTLLATTHHRHRHKGLEKNWKKLLSR